MFGFFLRMNRMVVLLLFPVVFFTTVTTQHGKVCERPVLDSKIEMADFQMFFNPGAELSLSCKHGYTPVSGTRRIVCGASGVWTRAELVCTPMECPNPGQLFNGEMFYKDTVYQSTVNYTCNMGYIMSGLSSAVCQANGTWSSDLPVCKPVTCGLAPIPHFGMVIYDRTVRGNSVNFGVKATYKCLPPYAVSGNPHTECSADGTWTKTPQCRVVTCPPPQNIANGYMSNQDQKDYNYMETIRYGCEGNYQLEGSREIVCQEDGTWSERPTCQLPS